MYENIKDYEVPRPKKCYRLISGEKRNIMDTSVIAYCTSKAHPGFLTLGFIYKHQCFFKNCPCLRKLPEVNFWNKPQEEYTTQTKYAVTKKGQALKEKSDQERKRCVVERTNKLIGFTKSCIKAHQLEEQFLMVDIKPFQNSSRNFRVFYVSNKSCYDAQDYLSLVQDISKRFNFRIKLVHVKDEDGHYVTIEEYKNRRRK